MREASDERGDASVPHPVLQTRRATSAVLGKLDALCRHRQFVPLYSHWLSTEDVTTLLMYSCIHVWSFPWDLDALEGFSSGFKIVPCHLYLYVPVYSGVPFCHWAGWATHLHTPDNCASCLSDPPLIPSFHPVFLCSPLSVARQNGGRIAEELTGQIMTAFPPIFFPPRYLVGGGSGPCTCA